MTKYIIILIHSLFLSFAFNQDTCTCDDNFTPVCGIDGFTYPNECMALCFGVAVDYDGECGSQISCDPGLFFDGVECMPCYPGTYSMGGSATSCDACLPGTISNGILECDINDPEYAGMTICGGDSCIDCPPGTYASADGMGDYCYACPIGTSSMGGAPYCEACPPGTMSNGILGCDDPGSVGMIGCGGDSCMDCPPGTYASADGMGDYCYACPLGTYSMGGANQCEACPPGTMSNGILECDDPGSFGMIGCGGDSCMDCPPGTYASADGMGDYCYACPLGTYSMGGSYQCEACPPGTMSNGILECDDPGSFGMIGCGGDSCMDCPPGTYASADGMGDYCYACPLGTYSMGGANQCEACPPGTISNGILGCDDPASAGMIGCGGDSCMDCPPGTYAPADGGGEYCMMCPQGTYSMGGSHQCEECPPNLMSNGIYTCDDGSFMNECGGDSCVDCAGNPWGNAYLEWNDDFTFEECIDIDNITGCTYSAAYNFNIDAINDDGSCSFPCPGDFNEDNSKDILDIIILLDDILNYVPCP